MPAKRSAKPKPYYCIMCGAEYTSAPMHWMLRCGHPTSALVNKAESLRRFEEERPKKDAR